MKAEWISVKDELPKEGQEVLVQTEATICETYFEKGDFDYNRITQAYANEAGIGTADKVLKWKPIQKSGWDMSSEEIADEIQREGLKENIPYYASMIEDYADKIAQSQLQALKEEVKELLIEQSHMINDYGTEMYKCEQIEADKIFKKILKKNKEVLNIITNLEGNE